MSKEKQHNILIASVLKPLDDHRLSEKWGRYFNQKQNYKIHIFGRNNHSKQPYYTHNSLEGNSLKNRIKAIFNYSKLLKSLKPKIVIITTFELLLVSYIYSKRNKSTAFFYDVSENYKLNLKSQGNYSIWKLPLLIKIISFNESIVHKFIKHYFYTEEIYRHQMKFLQKSNSTLIENRYSYPVPIKSDNKSKDITFLITGTISDSYGLKTGLEWFEHIKTIFPNAKLKIVGHSTTLFNIEKSESIITNISNAPLSHKLILQEIANADYILMPYKWSESFYGCTPTKLYEALELNTPVIISESDHLNKFISNAVFQIRHISEVNKKSLNNLISSDSENSYPSFKGYNNLLNEILAPYLLE